MQDNQQEVKQKKINIWLPFLLAVTLAGGMVLGFQLQPTHGRSTLPIPKIAQKGNKIEDILRYVESRYVDKVNRDELEEAAIDGILKHLDPHTSFIASDQLTTVNEQLQGNFEGIGVEFFIMNDTIMIVSAISGGPSEKVGIRAGDKIVTISDTTFVGEKVNNESIVKKLRGKKGTKVKVGIRRGQEKTLRDFTITRDKIPLHSVDVSYMIDEETGYIKVNRFSATTYEEFMKGVEHMSEKENMKNLIIDLRQNPGGYLNQATNILSQLFDDNGKLLVYTEGRSYSKNEYKTTGRNYYDLEDVVVLIDEGSASASEIMAGAIQDWDRGTIVGRRSFGKGLVQEQYNLSDGSALRLTVARYYTPSGRSIQKPYEKGRDNYDQEMTDRFNSGELENSDSIKVQDSTKYYTLKDGDIVFGGGGIHPDFFIPMDSIINNTYYLDVRPFIPEFVYDYMDDHRSEFEYGDVESFKKNFNVSEIMMENFKSKVRGEGIQDKPEAYRQCKSEIRRYIKAYIARQLFKEKGFYSVWNQEDDMVQKALKEIEDK